jgi:integrase
VANIKRVGEKKYKIVYDVPPTDGRARQQKKETLVGVTRHEAEAIRAKRIESIKKGEYVHETDMSMAELFEKFMATRKKWTCPDFN